MNLRSPGGSGIQIKPTCPYYVCGRDAVHSPVSGEVSQKAEGEIYLPINKTAADTCRDNDTTEDITG